MNNFVSDNFIRTGQLDAPHGTMQWLSQVSYWECSAICCSASYFHKLWCRYNSVMEALHQSVL